VVAADRSTGSVYADVAAADRSTWLVGADVAAYLVEEVHLLLVQRLVVALLHRLPPLLELLLLRVLRPHAGDTTHAATTTLIPVRHSLHFSSPFFLQKCLPKYEYFVL
jgi:hypothetical protein